MSRYSLYCLCFIALLASGFAAFSQDDTVVVQMPMGPMMESAPLFSSWTVTYTYPEDEQAKGKKTPLSKQFSIRPRKSVITKTADIIRIQVEDAGGGKTEKWFVGQKQYTLPSTGGAWFVSNNGDGARDTYYSPALPPSGFPDTDWINQKSYAGMVRFQNRDCLAFIPGGLNPALLVKPSQQIARLQSEPTIAYVDAQSRLPVLLRIAGEIRQYQFETPPTQALILPTDLQDQIQQGEKARKLLGTQAALPY